MAVRESGHFECAFRVKPQPINSCVYRKWNHQPAQKKAAVTISEVTNRCGTVAAPPRSLWKWRWHRTWQALTSVKFWEDLAAMEVPGISKMSRDKRYLRWTWQIQQPGNSWIFTANCCSTYTGRRNVMTAKPTSLNGQFAARGLPLAAPSFRAETPNLWSLWCFGRWNDLVQVLQMKPLRCRLRRELGQQKWHKPRKKPVKIVSWESRQGSHKSQTPGWLSFEMCGKSVYWQLMAGSGMPNFSSSHFKRTCYISKHVCVWNCSVLNRSRIQAQLSPCKENIYKGNKYGLPSEAKHTKHIKTPKFATVPQDVWKRHTLYCSSAQDMYRVEIIDIMRYHEISWLQTVSTLPYSLPFKRAIHGAFMGFVFWALTAGALVPFKDAHIVVTKLAASASSSLVLAEIGRGIGETDPTTEHGFMRVLSYFQRSSDFSCSFRVPFTFSKCSFG